MIQFVRNCFLIPIAAFGGLHACAPIAAFGGLHACASLSANPANDAIAIVGVTVIDGSASAPSVSD
jgi:hypothetical protein